MPLAVLTLALTLSLLFIKLFLLPFDWLNAFSLPIGLYAIGAIAVLSWCLGD